MATGTNGISTINEAVAKGYASLSTIPSFSSLNFTGIAESGDLCIINNQRFLNRCNVKVSGLSFYPSNKCIKYSDLLIASTISPSFNLEEILGNFTFKTYLGNTYRGSSIPKIESNIFKIELGNVISGYRFVLYIPVSYLPLFDDSLKSTNDLENCTMSFSGSGYSKLVDGFDHLEGGWSSSEYPTGETAKVTINYKFTNDFRNYSISFNINF